MGKALLAIVGMAGSGKSEVVKFFRDIGYESLRFGQIVIDECLRRGLEINADNERAVREDLRKQGLDIIAKLSLAKLESLCQGNKKVVVDGLYSYSEYLTLSKYFNLTIVNVFTDRRLRYDRLGRRTVRPLTAIEAAERDHLEIVNLEKGGPIALADYTIVNNGSLEELYSQLEGLTRVLSFN